MGLWDKFKGAFGRKKKDEDADYEDADTSGAYESYGEDIGGSESADSGQSEAYEDLKREAEEKERVQQEFEEAMRQAKEEQARQEQQKKNSGARTKTKTPEEEAEDRARAEAKAEYDAETREYMQRKHELELEKARLNVAQAQGKIAESPEKFALERQKLMATTRLLEQRRKESKKKGMEGTAKRFGSIVKNVSTLGGAVHMSKARKGFYVPKASADYYVPGKAAKMTRGVTALYSSTGMKELNMPQAGRTMQTSTLRRAGTPSYEKLRQATSFRHTAQPRPSYTTTTSTMSPIAKMATGSPRHLAKPMGFVKIGSQAQDVAMERLRGLTFPTGLTNTEKLAYAEIKANHDIDTKSHVVSELMDLGIDKLEASRAIEGLLHRRIVKRAKAFEGESTLEIV